MDRLLKNLAIIVTMDDDGQEFENCDIRIQNGEIVEIGRNLDANDGLIEDLSGRILTPG